MTENHNQDGSDGILTRRGLFGAALAASGFGLASMTGTAAAQEGTVYFQDAYIGASSSRESAFSDSGYMYFETDTGDIYYDNDGSGWQDLSGGLGSRELTVIDSQQSSYATEGSSVVYVDSSSGGTGEPVTLTIDASSEVGGAPLEIYDVGENAGTNTIRIENSSGELVIELGTDRAYVELIYQEPRWLVKTSRGEGIWNTYSESVNVIPDSNTWESLSTSESFWLNNNTEFFYNNTNPGSGDTIEKGQAGVDEFMTRVANGDFTSAGSVTSIDNTVTSGNGGHEYTFTEANGRYRHDSNDIGGSDYEAYTSVGPWSLSSVSTFNFFHEHTDANSISGSAIVLVDPDDVTNYETADILTSSTTNVSTFDVSSISGEREIWMLFNNSSNDLGDSSYADLYFE